MSRTNISSAEVRRYLLGEASNSERLEIEERSSSDAEFAEVLDLAESRLIDDFVFRQLSSAEAEAFENLTLVKIPTAILQKCEWGRDDYSLNIANLPLMENDGAPTADALPLFAEGALFGGETGDE